MMIKQKRRKDYNERKLEVLKTASIVTNLTPAILQKVRGISYNLAKSLLNFYHKSRLLTHPRRGIYRLSKRGRDRLNYLNTRIQISKVVGIDIGLNHHRDNAHPKPMYDILKEYTDRTGEAPPRGFF